MDSVNTFGTAAAADAPKATLTVLKTVDKASSYLGDTVVYHLAVKNTGNVDADDVVITDVTPNGAVELPGTLTVSVPYTGLPSTGLVLSGPIAPGATVVVSFAVKVTSMPVPNPMLNQAKAAYTYTVDATAPDAVAATALSAPVATLVFRYNFGQQVSDLIESVALEEAALAAIANAEGAKIQKMVAMDGITQQELLCLNKSVSDMLESITMLESILKMKLNAVACRIDSGNVTC